MPYKRISENCAWGRFCWIYSFAFCDGRPQKASSYDGFLWHVPPKSTKPSPRKDITWYIRHLLWDILDIPTYTTQETFSEKSWKQVFSFLLPQSHFQVCGIHSSEKTTEKEGSWTPAMNPEIYTIVDGFPLPSSVAIWVRGHDKPRRTWEWSCAIFRWYSRLVKPVAVRLGVCFLEVVLVYRPLDISRKNPNIRSMRLSYMLGSVARVNKDLYQKCSNPGDDCYLEWEAPICIVAYRCNCVTQPFGGKYAKLSDRS